MANIDNIIQDIVKSAQDYLNNESEKMIEKYNKDFYEIANEVNDLYFKEANKIYNSFIHDYYLYETDFYIRHWEGRPGTKSGTNLYYGNQMKIHRGKDPYFDIIFDGSEMADDYEYDSADKVLDNVIFGIRGVPPFWVKRWGSKYNSRYFHYKGSLMGAFTKFINNYEEMATSAFMRRWKKIKK